MTELDNKSYSDYQLASSKVSMRTATRRASSTASAEEKIADREVLLNWLKSVDNLLEVWHGHFAKNSSRPIRSAEITNFSDRLAEVNRDMEAHLYSQDSLLSRLDYADQVRAWKSELTQPWDGLIDALNIYRNASERIDPNNLKDPAEVMGYEEVYYMKSKKIRQLFTHYREELARQVDAIQNLLLRGK
jgi:hypothetical protein